MLLGLGFHPHDSLRDQSQHVCSLALAIWSSLCQQDKGQQVSNHTKDDCVATHYDKFFTKE